MLNTELHVSVVDFFLLLILCLNIPTVIPLKIWIANFISDYFNVQVCHASNIKSQRVCYYIHMLTKMWKSQYTSIMISFECSHTFDWFTHKLKDYIDLLQVKLVRHVCLSFAKTWMNINEFKLLIKINIVTIWIQLWKGFPTTESKYCSPTKFCM